VSTEPTQTEGEQGFVYGELTEREREHELNILQTEKELRAALADAENAVSKVGSLLHQLTDGSSWHVEYAEGIDGRDATREIEQAEQCVRNVRRIVHELSGKGDR
jgi:hypothetical protein